MENLNDGIRKIMENVVTIEKISNLRFTKNMISDIANRINGYLIINEQGFILGCNEYICNILGYDNYNHIYRKNFIDFIHPEDVDDTIKTFGALKRMESLTSI